MSLRKTRLERIFFVSCLHLDDLAGASISTRRPRSVQFRSHVGGYRYRRWAIRRRISRPRRRSCFLGDVTGFRFKAHSRGRSHRHRCREAMACACRMMLALLAGSASCAARAFAGVRLPPSQLTKDEVDRQRRERSAGGRGEGPRQSPPSTPRRHMTVVREGTNGLPARRTCRRPRAADPMCGDAGAPDEMRPMRGWRTRIRLPGWSASAHMLAGRDRTADNLDPFAMTPPRGPGLGDDRAACHAVQRRRAGEGLSGRREARHHASRM